MSWQTFPYVGQFARPGSHEFSYRPLIDVTFTDPEKTRTFKALLDSGTEITMMNADIAELLGIDSKKCRPGRATGLNKEPVMGFISDVSFTVDKFNEVFTFGVLFLPDVGHNFDILFGQQDFFERFNVQFERSKRQFKLQLVTNP